jgi:hypothetical protein
VVVVILLVLGFCSISAGNGIEVVGGFLASLSPVNLLLAAIQPDGFLRASFTAGNNPEATRIAFFIGGVVFTLVYLTVVFFMHSALKKSFMVTVRRLAGTG